MQPRVLLSIALLGATLLLSPAPGHAQSSSAQAEQLFRDGKKLMGDKKFAEACAAFEGSYNLDAAVTTRINLADCREKNGQLATAWGLFLDTERDTRDSTKLAALNKTARDRAAKLEPRLSYLIINVPDESRVDGLAINRDGVAVDPLTWNRALPIDGGSYVIEGKAPGHEPWSTNVKVQGENDKQSVDVPRFKVVPLPAPGEARPEPGNDDDEQVSDADGGMSGKRKAALGLGVGGVLGLGTGLVFELLAQGERDDAFAADNNAESDDLIASANQKRSIAIGAAAVGTVCVGVAVYLWLTGGPSERPPSTARLVPSVGPDTVGLGLAGAF